MAGEWRATSLGNLCDDGVVELQTGPFGTQLHAHDYVTDGIPVVPTEAIRNRQIDHLVLPKISYTKAAELSRHRLEIDDILFARRGVQATGHIGVVRNAEEGFVCGTGAIRLRVIDKAGGVCPEFLSHVLANPASVSWFKFHAIGATMPNLNEGIIRSFPFSIPPLPEQRAIAHILGTLDDKIELNRRRNQTLEAMARTLFNDWFVEFGPVRTKMEGHEPYLPTDLWQLFPEQLDDEGKPEGWEMQPLSELLTIIGGGTPKTSVEEYWTGDIPWFSVVDTPSASDVFVVATEKSITAQGLAGSSARLIPKGTTIISARGTVGNLAIAGREMTFNQSCYGLRGTAGTGDYFVYHTAQQMVDQLKSMAHGSVFSTITRQTFEAIQRPVPPPSVLTAFEELVRGWFDAILSNVEESRILAQLRDTLLPKLISGKLRVNETEKIMDNTILESGEANHA